MKTQMGTDAQLYYFFNLSAKWGGMFNAKSVWLYRQE